MIVLLGAPDVLVVGVLLSVAHSRPSKGLAKVEHCEE